MVRVLSLESGEAVLQSSSPPLRRSYGHGNCTTQLLSKSVTDTGRQQWDTSFFTCLPAHKAKFFLVLTQLGYHYYRWKKIVTGPQ